MRSWNACLLASALAACLAPAAAPAPRQDAPRQDAPPEPKPDAEEDAAQQAPPAPQPADAGALFDAFAAMPGLEARFEEEKQLALLAAPLRTTGRLYFLPPGHLTRVVDGPEGSTVMLTPDALRMTGPDGEQEIDLRRNADVRTFVTSLVRVFAGDRAVLEASYRVDFAPSADGWSLTLTPEQKPLTEMMRDLTLSGSGHAVRQLVLREPNGDRTVTRIVEADTARRFSPEERERLFGLAPR